jgi:hypothetical protein
MGNRNYKEAQNKFSVVLEDAGLPESYAVNGVPQRPMAGP